MDRTLFIVTTLVFARVGVLGKTITVDLIGGADYTDIQSAIDAAADGDTVKVKSGEYSIAAPLNFNRLRNPEDPKSSPLKNIVLISEAGPTETSIRMSDDPVDPIRRSVVIFESDETELSRLEGFTITGGSGTGNEPVGGGVLCSGSSPVLVNCRIIENSALFGAGLYCVESSPTLIDCTIDSNLAGRTGEQSGGGAYLTNGSSPQLSRCTISGNFGRFGAGVLCRQNCSPTLTNCTIIGNSSLSGAGLHCTVNSSPMLTNCRLTGNLALNAGALLCDENSAPTLTNCTIMENESGAIECTILSLTNCIVWDNSGLSIRSADPSLVTVTYSCIEGAGVWPGEGNINKNPLILGSGFWDTNGSPLDLFEWEWIDGDYHLQPGSPCFDTGTSLLAPAVDLDDFGRPCGGGVDMGAYESGDCPPPTRFKRGDADADGESNVTDVVIVLEHLFGGGEEPSCAQSADANDSGMLDLTDAVYLLNFLFAGGAPPAAPFAECGPDLTPDALSCDSFPGC